MIAKVIVLGRNRTEAIAKMRTALEEMVVVGVQTNLDFQYSILENETFWRRWGEHELHRALPSQARV